MGRKESPGGAVRRRGAGGPQRPGTVLDFQIPQARGNAGGNALGSSKAFPLRRPDSAARRTPRGSTGSPRTAACGECPGQHLYRLPALRRRGFPSAAESASRNALRRSSWIRSLRRSRGQGPEGIGPHALTPRSPRAFRCFSRRSRSKRMGSGKGCRSATGRVPESTEKAFPAVRRLRKTSTLVPAEHSHRVQVASTVYENQEIPIVTSTPPISIEFLM
jgi:hypothetical protein